MVIKDKVAAAVFVDATAEDAAKLDAASIQLLVFTTGLLVDTLAIRKKVPSPSLSGDDAAAPSQSAAPARTAAAPAAAPSAPAVEPPPAAPELAEANATVSMTSQQMREVMQGQRPTFNMPSADEFSGASSVPQSAKATTPSIPATPPPATPTLGGGEREDRPSTQYVPPSGVGRGGALGGGAQNEEAKRHDEARRFARLLVSEIKLYNEPKVDAGRKNRDLYERLKEDIDRSRQMYDERIPEDVRKTSNYFYDELVRILADGNAESLGL
jgi:hypothetical protein